MRILLDIDGVMAPVSSWKPSELLADGFVEFSIRAIANLQRIISETGSSIVLTTSHKANYSLPEWESIFNTRGIFTKIDKLNSNTDNLSRKDEILIWLGNEAAEDFVIIDDDKSLNDLPAPIKKKLVLTSSMIGLNEYDTAMAIEILHSAELMHA